MWENFKHTLRTIGIRVTGKTLSTAVTATLVSMGVIGASFMLAIPIGVALAGFIDHLDQRFELDKLTGRYRDEIAARLGKNPAQVTAQDLHQVAEGSKDSLPSNPVLKEATNRIHAKHMVSFLTTVAAGAVAIGAGFMMIGAGLSGLALAAPLFATAFIANEALSRTATRILHLNAPTLNDRVSAIGLKRGKVKEFEMFGLAAEANPGLAKQIQQEFGTEFRQMRVRQKVQALERFSESWNIPQITEEFNQGMIRETELSFALVGQSSGVPKKPPPVPLKERAQAVVEKGKDFGHSVWMHLKVKNSKTGKEEDKLVICQPKTGCVTLDNDVSEKLLPLLAEQDRINNGESAKSFTGRYLQEQTANDNLQQRS